MTHSPGRGKTVLVVDDEYVILQVLREALELDGYRVVTANNGREALDILQHQKWPSLILLDMLMPVMGGRAFLECVARDVEMAAIPVLVVSATAHETRLQGTNIFLRKPPDLEALLQMVEQCTSARSAAC